MTEEPIKTKKNYLSAQLSVNSEAGVASLILSPSETKLELTRERVLELLADQQVAHWLIYDGAIDDLLIKFKKSQPCQIIIAEKKDALLDIKLSANGMSATLFVLPAKGGSNVTEEQLNTLLTEKKIIKDRILASAFKQAMTTTQEISLPIARGKPPKNGDDSQFIPLVELPEDNGIPHEQDDGTVDFLAGKYYLTVKEGTPLLERTPATPGKVGMDIFGQILSPQPGKEIPFSNKMEGVSIDSNNPNIIVAERGGHPVFFDKGVRVDDTLTFKEISLESGHVEFDGSVLVKGDIHPEMKVKVSGDLVVKGVIERAKVVVGHNLTVNGGILGDSPAEPVSEEDEEPGETHYECSISAGGNIEARYANIAHLHAIGSIYLREYAFNCDIHSHESVYLGQNGGKGNLVGGICVAQQEVVARTLGNQAYQKTYIRVGVDQDDFRQSQKLLFLRQQRLDQARSLRKIMDSLKTQGQTEKLGTLQINKAKKVHESLLKLQEQIQQIDETLRQFEFASSASGEPNISAKNRCFPNCQLVINGAVLLIKEEYKANSFVKRGRQVTAMK